MNWNEEFKPVYKVTAFKEVILSSGVIQALQLLELSGIGDPEVLRQAGVQCCGEPIHWCKFPRIMF